MENFIHPYVINNYIKLRTEIFKICGSVDLFLLLIVLKYKTISDNIQNKMRLEDKIAELEEKHIYLY